MMSSTHRLFVDFLVERHAGQTRMIAELQTLVGDDPASRLQFGEEFIRQCRLQSERRELERVTG
jgi:hypothetical protein